MEQLQSHIWLTASSYMGKYLRVSSYIRKPFLIYDFATAPLWISLYMRKIWFSFLLVRLRPTNTAKATDSPAVAATAAGAAAATAATAGIPMVATEGPAATPAVQLAAARTGKRETAIPVTASTVTEGCRITAAVAAEMQVAVAVAAAAEAAVPGATSAEEAQYGSRFGRLQCWLPLLDGPHNYASRKHCDTDQQFFTKFFL